VQAWGYGISVAAFFWYQWEELKGMAGGQQPPGASIVVLNGSPPATGGSSHGSNGSNPEAGRLSRASSQVSLAQSADHQAVQMSTAAGEDQQRLLQNEE
jgi:hypothetical protein